ncbi:MAG: cytidine deaminase [Endomicrobia bacterium]|nr:cytidine deaminase [Endomicrobiia bacterium]MCL2145315.1 cytidine deaminase [Endomicrobiia bacterium]
MKEKKYIKLIEEAKAAAKNSRSKYSKFSVGSAVLCASGKIYKGTNIENASYGLTNCAERSALFNAVSAGEKNIEIVAVWTKSGSVFPCGACRQVILELAPQADIVVNKNAKDIIVINIKDLLPYSFSGKNLKRAIANCE